MVEKESKWYPDIVREVDMTRDRKKFSRNPVDSCLPIIEGRMVQSHHFGAKIYISGTGRTAVWVPVAKGRFMIVPQFWIKETSINKKVAERSKMARAGFCDIAGQTNERSMMAALIPPRTVCGNKVPTITFPNDPSLNRLLLWIGIVNSFPFDWMLRRVLTTTVNYFLLLSLPLPHLDLNEFNSRHIIKAVEVLNNMISGRQEFNGWKNAELRVNIDIAVLTAYGLRYEDLVVMLDDFPLLDRGQPSIRNEKVSTITCDYLLLVAAKHFGKNIDEDLQARVDEAKSVGAVPYIPSEMATVEMNNAGKRNMTTGQTNGPRGIKRIVYKEIVEGDRLKFEAMSNHDASAGGGARDLRFRPYDQFRLAFERMLPHNNHGILEGQFNWIEGDRHISREAYYHPPTNSRPNEGRISNIDKYLPGNMLPDAREGIAILLIIQRDDDTVWISFTTENSLKNDSRWNPQVSQTILGCLCARRRQNVSAAGYVDFETGGSFCNGQ
ncbi:hypothetical protein RE628_07665 [Paenibacillus sp. D2_2]|uniref:hypothetical protein n=1 Tax=Paenibacillus sp. D2_2 TaxID=3073092 RepID=UPI002815E5F8|nr:hypothetical protein [Paenibacillus sp. D2_2]WMT42271.1 hypothetical protein RE628_07665 [Paenibacillus sp. D2_2]